MSDGKELAEDLEELLYMAVPVNRASPSNLAERLVSGMFSGGSTHPNVIVVVRELVYRRKCW